MTIMQRIKVPHCYDIEYIKYMFLQEGIDINLYIHEEDVIIFLSNCLKAEYFRLVTEGNLDIRVSTHSFIKKCSLFTMLLKQEGYLCTLYNIPDRKTERTKHNCVLYLRSEETLDIFLKRHPEIRKHNLEVIKEGVYKGNFDLSSIKPQFNTRELPKLLNFGNLRIYVLKLFAGENPCNVEILPLNS
jgi:hypothetical protein